MMQTVTQLAQPTLTLKGRSKTYTGTIPKEKISQTTMYEGIEEEITFSGN